MAGRITKGITLTVARTTLGDFTIGGVSGKHDCLTLVGVIDTRKPEVARMAFPRVAPMPPSSRVFEPNENQPPVAFLVRNVGGVVLCVVPVVWDAEARAYRQEHSHSMAGGNFAESCDSRVSELAQQLTGHVWYGAFAVHDRVER